MSSILEGVCVLLLFVVAGGTAFVALHVPALGGAGPEWVFSIACTVIVVYCARRLDLLPDLERLLEVWRMR